MKKGTRKCKECGKWSSPIWQSYYRVKKGRTTSIKRREIPISLPRNRCAHCDAKLRGE